MGPVEGCERWTDLGGFADEVVHDVHVQFQLHIAVITTTEDVCA